MANQLPFQPDTILRLDNEKHTEFFGKILAQAISLAPLLPCQPAIFLYGGLGSGKTTLVRALAANLPGGDKAEVASPSFTLANEYPTCPRMVHADLYRLGHASSLPEEIEESLANGAWLVMEWPEYLAAANIFTDRLNILLGTRSWLPSLLNHSEIMTYLDISNQPCETERLVMVSAQGFFFSDLLRSLHPALEKHFRSLRP